MLEGVRVGIRIAKVREPAHQNLVALMMHANAFEAQNFAVDSDVDVIAHGMWNCPPGGDGAGLPAEIKSVLDRIIEKRIGYAPITSKCLRGVR